MSRIRAQPLVINTGVETKSRILPNTTYNNLRSASAPVTAYRDTIKQLQQEKNDLQQQITALKTQLKKTLTTEAVNTEAVNTEAVNTEAVNTEAVNTEAVNTEAEEEADGLAEIWDLPTRMPIGPGIYKTVRRV